MNDFCHIPRGFSTFHFRHLPQLYCMMLFLQSNISALQDALNMCQVSIVKIYAQLFVLTRYGTWDVKVKVLCLYVCKCMQFDTLITKKVERAYL